MLKRVLVLLVAYIVSIQSLLGDDYYNYGQYPLNGYSVGGFIDKHGKLGEEGKEYIFHINGSIGYIHRVDTDGDPQMHPDNPDATGPIAKRTLTLISSHTISNAAGGVNAFYIDDTGIYYGPCGGVKRWDFDWSNETTVVSKSFCGQTFAGNPRTGDFWAGDTYRRIYKWDGKSWVYQLTYPNLGGSHHDGLTIANDTLFVSDMTSDYIATYKLDKEGNVINPAAPDHIYKYTASPVVENMGFGPNNHIWITAGSVVYEIGGGKLQEQLAECTQGLTLSTKWEMLSSRCDISNATGFRDAVIMKMVDDHLVVISDNNDTLAYYKSLGYETNTTLELSRGEGFWIKAQKDGIRHALNGVEKSIAIHLKKDTTRFIGLPDWHKINLDETFGNKPVKEIRFWDSNSSSWRKWQPNHVDTNLTEIVNGHGFYICVADDFDISLPNLPPVAKITGELNVTVGEMLSLSGTKSFDLDGRIVSYEWKEGNETLSQESTLQKSDFALGWHKVVLTVTDDDGAQNSKEVVVRILRVNTPPTITMGEDFNITQGQSRILAPIVDDPDGYILSYEWRVDGNLVATTPVLEIKDLSLGEHNVTLSVLDNDLGKAQASLKVTVIPTPDTTPPVITILGNNPAVVTLGSKYIDAGAIAVDDRDGNVSVQSSSSVELNKTGEYKVFYIAKDKAGNEARAFRRVIVQDLSSNKAPVVNLGEDKKIVEGEELFLHATASDSDGFIKSYSWYGYGTIESNGADATIKDLTPGTYTITVTVQDDKGAKASDSILVSVLSKDDIDTTPPIITILGDNPYIMQVGENYTDAGATAWDDRDGNVSVGVEYNITTSKAGVYTVQYSAKDRAGNMAYAYRSVLVQDKNITPNTPDTTPPVITLLGNNPMVIMQGDAFVDPGAIVVDDRDGRVGYSIMHNVDSSHLGSYKVHYFAKDKAGNEANATRKVYVKDPKGNKKPVAYAGDDRSISFGALLELDGSKSYDLDGDIVSYEWRDENRSIIGTKAKIEVSNLTFGTHTFKLIVKDNDGLSSSDSVTIRVIDPSDTTAPVAKITSPAQNSIIKLQAPIVGTAFDEHLDYYTIEISPVGKEQYIVVAKGNESVENDTLALLDATTLENGIYDIKLTAVDENGQKSEAFTKVIIKGKAKIGNFSFTVRDFDLKVGGIPVQVNRTYSTLQRFKKGDFTYGWSLDYQNVKVEENIHPGKDWKTTPDVLVGYCFKDKKQHIVNITLPDGTTESFEFKFKDECRHYFPNHFYDGPILKPLNGTTATLEVVDASDTVMMNDYGELIDSQTLELYNPSVYRLKLANGMTYEIKEDEGIVKITNLRGDTLRYTHDGIISSRLGEALRFERDSEDRIIKITDLNGTSLQYHYDSNGDMDYMIDQGGAKTEYHYLDGHLMSEYFAPDGLRITKNIYDKFGRLIKTIDPDGNVVEFTHNIEGHEEIVTDKLGRILKYVYDDDGNVLSYTNAAGETTTRTYDKDGNELSVTDPLGHTTTKEYDANGNLLRLTDALGHSETTSYNDKGSPIAITDKNGNSMKITYNDYNEVRHITTALGATTTYYYDQFGNKIESINEYNQTTKMEYEKKWVFGLGYVSSTGNLIKEIRPEGTIIEHSYDAHSNLLKTTTTLPDGTKTTVYNSYDRYDRLIATVDERGNKTSYEYDARGNKIAMTDIYGLTTHYEYNNHNKLIKTTYPDGTIEKKSYDAMDNLLSETNKDGYTTKYEYDAANRLIKTIYPDGSTLTHTYDAAGRMISTTDENGHTTSYEYDAVGNKIAQIDALGNKTSYSYDANGNLLTITNALGLTTKYEYNALNQRVKTIYPDGSTLVESKNISGLPSVLVDEAGNRTNYNYDTNRSLALLHSVTLANKATTNYLYDALGRKIAQIDALGRISRWSYEPTGELKEEILPDGSKQSHIYSPKGLEVAKIDYAGKSQKFVYNAYKQLVRIEYSDGSTVTYDYTPSGKIKSITDASGTVRYSYDSRGRIKTRTAPNGDTISYTYDAVGNITRIETPTQTIEKTYDALNRLTSVTDAQGTTSYEYDAIGRQTKVTYPNGVSTSYAYDSRNRVTKIEHTNSNGETLLGFSYTYDVVGNRLSETRNDGRRVEYEYNEVNQLTKATVTNDPNGNDTTTTYAYDKVGNLISKTVEGIEHTYTYDALNRLIQKDGITLSYDANGNLIDDGTNTYEWDEKNRLVKVTTPNETVEYIYDAEDNRIAKIINGDTTTYLIDSNTPYAQVITESKTDGTEIHYTYGNDLVGDGTHYYLTDALGSTRGLVDSAETLTDSYDYKPYGEIANHTGTSENSFLFTGEQLDKETDNYYLRARYYSPNFTRFLSRDTYNGTASNPITQNHYLYANSNPVLYTDPSGLMSISEVSMSIGIQAQLMVMRFPKLAIAVEAVGGAVAPVEFSLSTPYAWVGVSGLAATTFGAEMHKMAATALSLKRTSWWLNRFKVGKEWEEYVLNKLLHIPISNQQKTIKVEIDNVKRWAFADAVYDGSIIEIKSRTFTRRQAEVYAEYVKNHGEEEGIFGATYLFLIKPAQTEIEALSKIFSDRGVALQVNYIFDF